MNIQVGDTVPIELQIADGATNQYPRALVYSEASALLITIDLAHDNQGNYSGNTYVMPNNEFVKVVYIVYSDSGHTTLNTDYERDLEIFYRLLPDEFKADVSLLALETTSQLIWGDTNELQINQGDWLTAAGFSVPNEYDFSIAAIHDLVERTLGLVQENQFMDTTVYDGDGNLTSARLRIYSDASSVGSDINVMATYTITSTYTGTTMDTYKMVKV